MVVSWLWLRGGETLNTLQTPRPGCPIGDESSCGYITKSEQPKNARLLKTDHRSQMPFPAVGWNRLRDWSAGVSRV